ncbi:hypothetical protein TcWFU_001760 [Taenia crassiceps]|uniref:Uncharacterized protein n=1 Tax=Taenia crassiceps TaxID=6207 RepID=A0ABR4Q298_9CEST
MSRVEFYQLFCRVIGRSCLSQNSVFTLLQFRVSHKVSSFKFTVISAHAKNDVLTSKIRRDALHSDGSTWILLMPPTTKPSIVLTGGFGIIRSFPLPGLQESLLPQFYSISQFPALPKTPK